MTLDIALRDPTTDWKVLIIDDDEEVHTVTRLVLSTYNYAGKGLDLMHAYSAKEALEVLQSDPDIAVALVDCVMETDRAGLDLVREIREVQNNHKIRLVLRTGQPGYAPEEQVIKEYDINDYKDKTELTNTNLKTLMYTNLRAYKDIATLDLHRQGLEIIINAMGNLFHINSFPEFASAILNQLVTLLGLGKDAAFVKIEGFAAESQKGGLKLLAGTGDYQGMINKEINEFLSEDVINEIRDAASRKENIVFEDHLVVYFASQEQQETILYINNFNALDELDKHLINTFCTNLTIAYELNAKRQ
jgi:response regulator RpfG family c-di-GMP phosphodiesterase